MFECLLFICIELGTTHVGAIPWLLEFPSWNLLTLVSGGKICSPSSSYEKGFGSMSEDIVLTCSVQNLFLFFCLSPEIIFLGWASPANWSKSNQLKSSGLWSPILPTVFLDPHAHLLMCASITWVILQK